MTEVGLTYWLLFRVRKQKRLKHKKPAQLSRASSISSVTDSTLSLNIITVTLNMDTVNFLGISIVGQSNQVEVCLVLLSLPQPYHCIPST